MLDSPEAAWPALDDTPRPSPHSFTGFSLDAQQRPTLRYSVDGFSVEDFFIERRDTSGRVFIERTLKFPAAPPAAMHFRVAVDKIIEPRGAHEFAVGNNLRVRLPSEPIVRNAGEGKELLVPVRGELRIEYHLAAKP